MQIELLIAIEDLDGNTVFTDAPQSHSTLESLVEHISRHNALAGAKMTTIFSAKVAPNSFVNPLTLPAAVEEVSAEQFFEEPIQVVYDEIAPEEFPDYENEDQTEQVI